jgi:hypothetical protein
MGRGMLTEVMSPVQSHPSRSGRTGSRALETSILSIAAFRKKSLKTQVQFMVIGDNDTLPLLAPGSTPKTSSWFSSHLASGGKYE